MPNPLEDICNQMLSYVNEFKEIKDTTDERLQSLRENNNEEVHCMALRKIKCRP